MMIETVIDFWLIAEFLFCREKYRGIGLAGQWQIQPTKFWLFIYACNNIVNSIGYALGKITSPLEFKP
jgi:hypothetical protein